MGTIIGFLLFICLIIGGFMVAGLYIAIGVGIVIFILAALGWLIRTFTKHVETNKEKEYAAYLHQPYHKKAMDNVTLVTDSVGPAPFGFSDQATRKVSGHSWE